MEQEKTINSKIYPETSTPPGRTVSEQARERLMAAVQKTPEPGQYRRPSQVVNQQATRTSGGAFNNLIQRMTGNRDKINTERLSFVTKQKEDQASQKNSLGRNDTNLTGANVDRLEVPAFLRRQAN